MKARVVSTVAILAAAGLLASCKTSEAPARPPKKTDLTLERVAEDRPVAPRFEKVKAGAVAETQGFGLDGEASCLPLPEGRECLERADATAEACAKVGGETLRCEDCSVLCSVDPGVAPDLGRGVRP